MIWYICFILAIVIAVFIARLALDKRMGKLRILYILLAFLLMAYTIYIPPYFSMYDFTAAIFGGFINVLQIISLDSDYLQFYSLIKSAVRIPLIANLYYVFLALIHVLLPTVSAMTAVTLVVQCLTELKILLIKKKRKSLHVFSQISDEAITLARDIRDHDRKCDILFLDDVDDSNFTELKQELGCSILNEKIENIKVIARNRQVNYYCIYDNEENNLDSALTIIEDVSTKAEAIQKNNHIFIFSTDPHTEAIIDSVSKGLINIVIVDKYRSAVYKFLEKYPLFNYAKDKNIDILICGFSDMSKTFLRLASWCGQLRGYTLNFTVVGKDIENHKKDFMAKYPGLFSGRYNISFESYSNLLEFDEILKGRAGKANVIFVAEEKCTLTVEMAIKLRRFMYVQDENFENAPPVFAYIENESKSNAIAALSTAEAKPERRQPYNITPFGTLKDIYSYKNITDSDIENLSKNVHLAYEEIFSDGEIDVEDALRRYNLFEVNKNSNRANALHIRYKLLMAGLDYTEDENAEEVDFNEYLSEEMLRELMIAEHDRWMAFYESEGWVESTVQQVKAYQKSGISKGRHNCPLLKMHPYICDFDELAKRSEELGLPDSTVYDIELIARIPDILHDKWDVMGKKYKIVQLTKEEDK